MRSVKLSWNMSEDGVAEVSATDADGRMFPVLDIYRQPLVLRAHMKREEARAFQIEAAERICAGWNIGQEELRVHVAKRMLADMEDHGGVDDFCEKLCGFPEQYLSELAAGAIDCISLSGRLKPKP